MKEPFVNSFGEIEWHNISKALKIALTQKVSGKRKLAEWHWGKRCYVSYIGTVEQIERILKLLKSHNVNLQVNKRSDWFNKSPDELIEEIRKQRWEMSRAEEYAKDLPGKVPAGATSFQLAGASYVFHTKRCIIADPYSEDRLAEVLVGLDKSQEYPALLICREKDRASRIEEIKRYATEIVIYDLQESTRLLPQKSKQYIFLLTYSNIENGINMLLDKHDYYTVIADHIEEIRDASQNNSNFTHTQRLVRRIKRRFLLTDQLISGKPQHFEVPIKLLGIWNELDKALQTFIESPKDLLDMGQTSTHWLEHRRQIGEIYHWLRSSGHMLKRSPDIGFEPNEIFDTVKCSPALPEWVKQNSKNANMSVPRYVGLCKAKDIVARVMKYLADHPKHRILIVAHHNDVVEFLRKEFDVPELPTIYGKERAKGARQKIANKARLAKQGIVIILAQDINLDWDIGPIDMIFFAEMRNTYDVQKALRKRIIKRYPDHSFSITYFMTYRESNLDPNAKVRKNISKQMEEQDLHHP